MKHIKPFTQNLDVYNEASSSSNKSSEVSIAIGDLIKAILNGETGKSLTTATKKTLVSSVVYVDTTLVEEDITVPTLLTLNKLFISYVLTALSIYNLVDGYKEIEETIGRVATEVLRAYSKETSSTQDVLEVALEALEKGDKQNNNGDKTGGAIRVVDAVNKDLAIGKLIIFTFKLDRGGKQVLIPIPILVQLLPTNISPVVIDAIFSLNFLESTAKRLIKVKTGEIRFFRDFILGLDLAKKHADALKADTDNTLSKFYSNKMRKRWKYIKGILTGKFHNNSASSMFIVDKEVFDEALKNASINFDSYVDRQKFFNVSYAMIVVVVDRMSEIVDIYYNGIKDSTEASFRAIKSSNKDSIVDIMGMIAKGGAPKI